MVFQGASVSGPERGGMSQGGVRCPHELQGSLGGPCFLALSVQLGPVWRKSRLRGGSLCIHCVCSLSPLMPVTDPQKSFKKNGLTAQPAPSLSELRKGCDCSLLQIYDLMILNWKYLGRAEQPHGHQAALCWCRLSPPFLNPSEGLQAWNPLKYCVVRPCSVHTSGKKVHFLKKQRLGQNR